MKRHLRIHPKDNVAIALEPLEPGDRIEIDGTELTAAEPIPQAHKMAVAAIAAGEAVVKYGMPIGNATEDIAPGQHVHVHNLKTGLGEILEYGYSPAFESFHTSLPERKVHVYERSNKEVGIRNELWVVPTVGCVNGVAQRIIDRFRKEVDPVGIDGVFA
ncbi:UxaA family hydrolase, partial [Anaerotalea alkaliphila]